jgi:KaiC/GvpD/RAD55 family RecA-like ATPase
MSNSKDHDLTRAEIDEALDKLGPAFPPGDTKANAADAPAVWRTRRRCRRHARGRGQSTPGSARGAAQDRLGKQGLQVAVHPLIPHSPCIVIVCADEGVGKSSSLAQVAAAKTRAGKKVLYIYGEGSPEKNRQLMIAAGADMSNLVMVDCVVEHSTVQLDGMLTHEAIAKHLPGVDTIIVDVASSFVSESVKRYRIRQLLAPFHGLARKGITTFIAMHPNRGRNVRKPADRVPAGWAGSAEVVWQIEASDDQGHAVVEMTRGREYPKPWKRYEFWLGENPDGVRIAEIGAESSLSIMDLLAEKHPHHVPPSVVKAREWLLTYLAEHGPPLVETEIFPAGKAAGHSESAMTKAKAISSEIDHTPQGNGPSKWFLKADEQTQQDKRDDPIRKLETLRDNPSAPPGEIVAARAALARMSESVESVESVSDEQAQQTRPPEPPTIAKKKLWRVPVPLSEAHAFTDKYHRHLDGARANAKFAIGLKDDTGDLVAVLTAGRPSDGKTNQNTILELSRVTTKDNNPNACSILIKAATKVAVFLGCERVQTFTLPHEDGASYVTCHFRFDGLTKRSGRKDDPYPHKKRWVKDLPPQWHFSQKKARGRGGSGDAETLPASSKAATQTFGFSDP